MAGFRFEQSTDGLLLYFMSLIKLSESIQYVSTTTTVIVISKWFYLKEVIRTCRLSDISDTANPSCLITTNTWETSTTHQSGIGEAKELKRKRNIPWTFFDISLECPFLLFSVKISPCVVSLSARQESFQTGLQKYLTFRKEYSRVRPVLSENVKGWSWERAIRNIGPPQCS